MDGDTSSNDHRVAPGISSTPEEPSDQSLDSLLSAAGDVLVEITTLLGQANGKSSKGKGPEEGPKVELAHFSSCCRFYKKALELLRKELQERWRVYEAINTLSVSLIEACQEKHHLAKLVPNKEEKMMQLCTDFRDLWEEQIWVKLADYLVSAASLQKDKVPSESVRKLEAEVDHCRTGIESIRSFMWDRFRRQEHHTSRDNISTSMDASSTRASTRASGNTSRIPTIVRVASWGPIRAERQGIPRVRSLPSCSSAGTCTGTRGKKSFIRRSEVPSAFGAHIRQTLGHSLTLSSSVLNPNHSRPVSAANSTSASTLR